MVTIPNYYLQTEPDNPLDGFTTDSFRKSILDTLNGPYDFGILAYSEGHNGSRRFFVGRPVHSKIDTTATFPTMSGANQLARDLMRIYRDRSVTDIPFGSGPLPGTLFVTYWSSHDSSRELPKGEYLNCGPLEIGLLAQAASLSQNAAFVRGQRHKGSDIVTITMLTPGRNVHEPMQLLSLVAPNGRIHGPNARMFLRSQTKNYDLLSGCAIDQQPYRSGQKALQ